MTVSPTAVIACAMPQELAPFLEHATEIKPILRPLRQKGVQKFYTAKIGGTPVVLAQSGIGLVNSAVAATRILEHFNPKLYVLAGTTGGLASHVKVGDVIAGTSALYFDADATAFEYELGQTPGMPTEYRAETAGFLVPTTAELSGLILSGNSFVTAGTAKETRKSFPGALGVDMETAAAAQVCYLYNQNWLSLRAVSDLCGPSAHQEFHMGVEPAAALSFEAADKLLANL